MKPSDCSVTGCPRPANVPGAAKGLCKNHYMRVRRSGSVDGKRKPLADRFWAHVDRSDPNGCWPWVGHITSRGYGSVRVQGKNRGSHRVAWELAHPGEPTLTPSEAICHTCDNPVCCRPDHLFRGTFAENSADMTRKERQSRGLQVWSVKVTPEQVAAIRERYAVRDVRQVDLAREYGISQPQVSEIVRRKSWK